MREKKTNFHFIPKITHLQNTCMRRYSMWQLRQEINNKSGLDGTKKNRLRYVLQNSTKKEKADCMVKFVSKSARKNLSGATHLLTPNKFSTFLCVEEFKEGGSFSFLSQIIDFEYHNVIGKNYTAKYSEKEETFVLSVALPRDSSSGDAESNREKAFLRGSFPPSQHNFSHFPSYNFGEQAALSTVSFFSAEPLLPSQTITPLDSLVFQSIAPNLRPSQFPPSVTISNYSNGSNLASVNETKSEEIPNQKLYLDNQTLPPLESLTEPLERHQKFIFPESFPKKTKKRLFFSEEISQNSKKPFVTDNEPSKVPFFHLEQRATLHYCFFGEKRVEFITHIDLKKILAEQTSLQRPLLNSALQIVENSFCTESSRFDSKTYGTFFEYHESSKFTRIFVLFQDKKFGQKIQVKRDEANKRWILFLIKKYKHFEDLPYIVINDSQLTYKLYQGPTQKIKDLLNLLGESVGDVPTSTLTFPSPVLPTKSPPSILSLLFISKDFCKQDHCDTSGPHELTIKGIGFRFEGANSVSVHISQAPVNLRKDFRRGKLFHFHTKSGAVFMLESTDLIKFLPEVDHETVEKLCLDCPFFNSPTSEAQSNTHLIQMFFLVDFLHVEGNFELRRIAKEPVWSLFLFSEKLHLLIDGSDFEPIFLTQIDPTLSSQFSKILHIQCSELNKKLSVSKFAPSFATKLEVENLCLTGTSISTILVPPLQEKFFTLWLTILNGEIPLTCLTRTFFVGNPVQF